MCIPKELKFLVVDASQCMGCLNCELACSSRKAAQYQAEGILENIRIVPNIIVGQNGLTKTPAYCRHCSAAFCKDLCPAHAISQENGVIILDKDKCLGCGICEQVCPYGVITLGSFKIGDKTKTIAHKCDLCFDQQSVGKEPACYAACPTKALALI